MSESTMSTDEWGNKFWRNSKKKYHRTDGPAIEYSYGGKEWYMDGKWHRLNGPAILYANGDTSWYVHGEFLGFDDEGFWALWDILTPEQKQDPTLLTYLPAAFSL